MNEPAPYQTREFSPDTWHDFEKLFSRGNGWDYYQVTFRFPNLRGANSPLSDV
jgi:hypothetical protein